MKFLALETVAGKKVAINFAFVVCLSPSDDDEQYTYIWEAGPTSEHAERWEVTTPFKKIMAILNEK